MLLNNLAEEIANGFSKKPPPLRRFNMASSLAKHVTNETIRLEHTNVNFQKFINEK